MLPWVFLSEILRIDIVEELLEGFDFIQASAVLARDNSFRDLDPSTLQKLKVDQDVALATKCDCYGI
jgi:hypothetical protein